MRQSRLMLAIAWLCLLPALVRAGDEAPAARAYVDWLGSAIAAVQADMPTISASAEAAAERFVAGGALSARGDLALREELSYRAGGLNGFAKEASANGDVLLYALGIATSQEPDAAALLARQLQECRQLRDAGVMVVAIASHAQLKSLNLLDRAADSCTVVLDNHAPADDGMFRDAKSGRAIVPTFVSANPVVAWAWTAELFAACTRRGQTPVVLQSVMLRGARQRNERYKGQRFHQDLKLPPIDSGLLGAAYTTQLAVLLREVGTQSWSNLVKAAETMRDVLRDGDRVVIHAVGHYPPHHVGGKLAADPNLFTPLKDAVDKARPDALGPGDFVLVLGYSWLPGDERWRTPDLLDSGGRGACYILSAYEDPGAVQDEQRIIIDQLWPAGDALVQVPGYDVRLGPPSGVIGEAILWALTAQLAAAPR